MRKYLGLVLIVLLFSAAADVCAAVTLPALFTDGMVLQRGRPVPVWGWASPGETVTVRLGRKSFTATAGADGCWRVDLPRMKAGGPYRLQVNDITVDDVMVGDVWLCSGQSNIDLDIERVYPQYKAELDADSVPAVRLFKVDNVAVTQGVQRDVKSAGWKRLGKHSAWKFSAVGYFLGKRMHGETGVAQGIIQSSWGGTPIEAWLPADSMLVYNPKALAETEYLNDDKLVADINSINDRLNNRWHGLLEKFDPGVAGKWTSPELDDSGWTKAGQYDLPAAEGRSFCGTLWVRQHITVDAAHAGKPALLNLGMLYDADYTYVNGREVGRTYYQYPPRRYNIPEGLLREGDNVITVRFVNKNGSPWFARDKAYRIEYSDTDHQPLSAQWLVKAGVQMPAQPAVPMGGGLQNKATTLWNGMLRPLAPYALSGVVWYQGESNTGRPKEYRPLLDCLMHSWREAWQQPDMPFAIVQLANYMAPSASPQNSGWAMLRESQRTAARDDARAGLAVAIDLGEAVDIHPLLKKEVADRCALVFDRLVFGKKVLLSPEPVSAAVATDGTVTVTFDQPLREGQVSGFELAAADGRFRNVKATAKGCVVTLAAVPGARMVRYAWKDNPVEADCRSADGKLPVVPFESKAVAPAVAGR